MAGLGQSNGGACVNRRICGNIAHMTDSPMREYLLADEVADELGVSETTVRRRYNDGDIPGHSVGRAGVIFLRSELERAGVLTTPLLAEAATNARIIACETCGSELAVYGDAQLEHAPDGGHIVLYASIEDAAAALAAEADA